MDTPAPGGDPGVMSVTLDRNPGVKDAVAAPARHTTTLFQRLLLFNAAVVVVGGLFLTLTPVTVSDPVRLTEVVVLGVGAIVMVAVNAILVRATLRPLDRLTALMERVDLLRPGQRLSMPADRDVADLARSTGCWTGSNTNAGSAVRTPSPPRRGNGSASPASCTTRSARA